MKKKKRFIIESITLIVIIAAVIIGANEKWAYLFNHIFTNPSTKIQNIAIAENGNTIVENKLKIHYIDVGQGDSILIQNENAAILIDGGTGESADKITKYLQEQGVKTLNYVIATHPHEDHIGGLDEAINSVKTVEHVWMPKKASSTKAFENLAKAIKAKNLKAEQPSFGQQIQLADMKITALGPMRSNYEQINDYSIVIKLEYKNKSFIFMGDAEKLVEKDIINAGIDVHSDLLKVGHHGSNSSSSIEFLDKVSPKYAVISLGEDNSYGHPHTETLQALKQKNITVYRTDRNGNVVATSDGDSISFEVEKGAKDGYTDTSKATNVPGKN